MKIGEAAALRKQITCPSKQTEGVRYLVKEKNKYCERREQKNSKYLSDWQRQLKSRNDQPQQKKCRWKQPVVLRPTMGRYVWGQTEPDRARPGPGNRPRGMQRHAVGKLTTLDPGASCHSRDRNAFAGDLLSRRMNIVEFSLELLSLIALINPLIWDS